MVKFTDLDLSLEVHPDTKDLITLKDDTAIKRAIKNIVLTNFYEKIENVRFGGNIYSELFENSTTQSEIAITNRIKECLNYYEPRIRFLDVIIVRSESNSRLERQRIEITVKYQIIGSQTISSINLELQKIR